MSPSIQPIGATSVASTLHQPAAAPPSRTALDKDVFLKLLVTQLRYQDPLNPSSPNEFLAQTAQFNAVEQLEELTKLMETANRSSQLSTAGTLVSRTVGWYAEDGTLRSGTVSAALSTADGITLVVGTEEVPLGAVVSIS